ncbi:hypothetical protein GC102_33525 [Paenibacillus sp. LMG 31460]|uniref:SH3 domain-containing protein n=1 Tax=Paenibacillus germinis TaxID=2654979 RepID=A0ABX1ZB73_9BACL|nr:hypothetical protein [Paenibacillus germinis]NOU90613.1 hypothetical protein [Paenibacillus germinis]
MRTLSVLLLLCGIVIASGCQQEKTLSKAVTTFEAVLDSIQEENGLQIDQTYTAQADIGARYDPSEISGAGPVFEVNRGDAFRILAKQDEYVQVESQDLRGWIPVFYFSKEAANIQTGAPYEMIVAKEVPVASSPGEKVKEPHLELWAGKVVHIEKSYGDWVAVGIVQYDAEYGADMWVPKSSLQVYGPANAKEGKLAQHSHIYDEHGQIKEEEWINPVFIQEETQIEKIGPVYQIIGAGGQTGYIRVKDFIPNPFIDN